MSPDSISALATLKQLKSLHLDLDTLDASLVPAMSEALASLPNLTSFELEVDLDLPLEADGYEDARSEFGPLLSVANQVTGLTHLTLKGGRSAIGG
jgi:hypothetical protein